MDNNKPAQEKVCVNTQSLKEIAIYLSGLKDGKGNLLPLGTIVLEDLWSAIKYLQGDVRFVAEKDKSNQAIDATKGETNEDCHICWGSGWETQFIKPCTICNGTGKIDATKGEWK